MKAKYILFDNHDDWSRLKKELVPGYKDNDILVKSSLHSHLINMAMQKGYTKIQDSYHNLFVNYGDTLVRFEDEDVYILDVNTRKETRLQRAVNRISHYFYFRRPSRSIVTLVGPDGCGKSAVSSALARLPRFRYVYYGDWGFKLQSAYSTILRNVPSPINRVVYLAYLVESLARYIYAVVLSTCGFYVVLDRQPGSKVPRMGASESTRFIHRIYFKMFRLGRMVLLHTEPSVVFRRKRELQLDEIEHTYKVLMSLGGRNIKVIENEDGRLDNTLNAVLRALVDDR